ESRADLALAISPKTVCSCWANPFTVSTRLGIRSARRCNTISTCDHAAFTASFLVTSVLRTPTYCPKKMSAITTITTMAMTAISPLLMRSSCETPALKRLAMSRCARLKFLIYCVGHLLDRCEIPSREVICVNLFCVGLVIPDIQHQLH